MTQIDSENRLAGVLNKLIVEMAADRQEIRGLASAVIGLTREMQDEREARIFSDRELREADAKLNERIARISREQARGAMFKALPLATAVGAVVAWVLLNGPDVIAAWRAIP